MKIIEKIIYDVILPIFMLLLLVLAIPLFIIEDIWHLFFPPKKDPREMTEDEQRFYYGYDERRDDNEQT